MKRIYLYLVALFYVTNAFGAQSQDSTLAKSSVTSYQGLSQWILSTLLVLGLIIFIAYILKKIKYMPRSGNKLSIISNLAVGPKERIVHIKVANGKEILVGVTASNINYLCDVTNDENAFSRIMQNEQKALRDNLKIQDNGTIEDKSATLDSNDNLQSKD